MSKNILIVGGNSGIGHACVKALAEHNQIYSLTRSGVVGSPIENVEYVSGDVHKTGLDYSFLPERLDAVIYCPGTINLKPFSNLMTEDFEKDFKINVIGLVNTIKAAMPALKYSGNASVIAFSTVAVSQGMSYHASVAAAKGAIEGLIRSLAAEYAAVGVRFNAIAPSLVNTPLASSLTKTESRLATISKRHPLNRIGEPDEIASMVKFLVSDDASWMTGQVLHVDGGLSSIKELS
ncbi:MAG: SDR family NAD(P)-dependent oxidoreductase [Gammaproteobacteria bacterium]